MDIGVNSSVEINLSGTRLSIVEEVKGIASHRHAGKEFAVVDVVGGGYFTAYRDNLLHAHAGGIILEFNRRGRSACSGSGNRDLLQSAACFPYIGTFAVAQRIADQIVGNRLAVVARQLVFPDGIIAVQDRLLWVVPPVV